MRRYGISKVLGKLCLLGCLFLVTTKPCALEGSVGDSAMASLRDYPWAERYEWIRDFDYERIMSGAPESTPERRRRLGGAERNHYPAYTMEMKEAHIGSLIEDNIPWVAPTNSSDERFIIGHSRGWESDPEIPAQPVFGYKITEPNVEEEKIGVVLVGGNHGREHPPCWALHAMIDFLVSDDPRAEILRRHVVFYLYPAVNPDGKYLLWSRLEARFHADANPEMAAAGHRNHNRIWNADGVSTSVDKIKAAMKRDFPDGADYLLDFHGVPHTSFIFSDKNASESPYGRALAARMPRMNQRGDDTGSGHPGMLYRWAVSDEGPGINYAFTPEIANPNKEYLVRIGRYFALALYDVVTGNDPDRPRRPDAMWLFEGDAKSAFENGTDGEVHNIEWSEDTRFGVQGNRSAKLGPEAYIEFGSASEVRAGRELTVAFWMKSGGVAEGEANIIGRWQTEGEERSWALTLDSVRQEVLLTASADGSYGWDRLKRVRSNLWPWANLFDERWRHVAFTFDGRDVSDHSFVEADRSTTPERVGGRGAVRLYLDGVDLKKGSGSHVFANGNVESLHPSRAAIVLGDGPDGNGGIDALVDELGIWTKVLALEEIKWLASHSLRELAD